MEEKTEIVNNILNLVSSSKKLYSTYLQGTVLQLTEIDQGESSDENAGKLLNLVAGQHYYLGQLDALENVENYIKLLLSPEPDLDILKYAQRID